MKTKLQAFRESFPPDLLPLGRLRLLLAEKLGEEFIFPTFQSRYYEQLVKRTEELPDERTSELLTDPEKLEAFAVELRLTMQI